MLGVGVWARRRTLASVLHRLAYPWQGWYGRSTMTSCMWHQRTRVSDILTRGTPECRVVACGWVKTVRVMKSVTFVEVSDGSCQVPLQVILPPNGIEGATEVRTGCSVCVHGVVKRSEGHNQRVDLAAERIQVVGSVEWNYPLQKKRHSLEMLRNLLHLRSRSNTFGAVARVRNRAIMSVHEFLQERGFLQIHTPVITSSDCEGAGDLFRVTSSSRGGDFWGVPAFLTVSGQLQAEAYACALSNVYTFNPAFRAEDSNTPRHLAEFWMVEPEMAWADLDDVCSVAEGLVRHVLADALEHSADELAFFDQSVLQGLVAHHESLVTNTTSFVRIRYSEAIHILQEAVSRGDASFDYPVLWGCPLHVEHERYLCDTYAGGRPTFVTHYPAAIKPFYMKEDDEECDRKVVACTDLLVPRVAELLGGSEREDRWNVLQRKLREAHMDEAAYAWYLDLRRFGSVPHAGFGLGFDRLLLFLTGLQNIRDVIPVPRVPGSCRM